MFSLHQNVFKLHCPFNLKKIHSSVLKTIYALQETPFSPYLKWLVIFFYKQKMVGNYIVKYLNIQSPNNFESICLSCLN